MIENTEVKEKKKSIVKLAIGILSLTVLILGATYAYWSASTMSNFNTAFISYDTGGLATVVLDGTSAILRLDIVGSDMNKGNKDKVYYASADGKTKTPTEEAVGVARPSFKSIRSYKCNFTLNLTHSGQNDFIDKFLGETNGEPNYPNRSAGQFILTVNGVEYDLNDGFPSTINGYLYTDYINNGTIDVGLKFINLKSVDQTDLANTDGIINIDVANNGFTCETVDGRAIYWAYEGNQVTFDTAKNKVDDYHKLASIGNTYSMVESNWMMDYYLTLSDCEAGKSNDVDNYDERCRNVRNDYYLIRYLDTYNYSSFNTESDCNTAIDGSDYDYSECVYNTSTEEWDVYTTIVNDNDLLDSVLSSEDRCQQKISYWELDQATSSCVHLPFDLYILYADNYVDGQYATLEQCENYANYMKDYYTQRYYLDDLVTTCTSVPVYPNIFVKETVGLMEVDISNNYWQYVNIVTDKDPYTSLESCQRALNEDIAYYNDENIAYDSAECVVAQPYTIELDNVNYINLSGYSHAYLIFDTQSECNTSLAMFSSSNNPRCIRATANDYVFEFYEDSFSTESDCNSYLNDNYSNDSYSYYYCIYNDSTEEWDLYGQNLTSLSPTESTCEYWLESSNGACVHPTVQKYYLYLDNVDDGSTYSTLHSCEAALDEWPEEYNPTCVHTTRHSLYYDNVVVQTYYTQAACQKGITYFQESGPRPSLNGPDYTNAENFRCTENSLSDYIIKVDMGSFDTESECEDFIDHNYSGFDSDLYTGCRYDSSVSKWIAYKYSYESIFSTLASCQASISGYGNSPYNPTCVHPPTQLYYLYVDNVGASTTNYAFNSEQTCELVGFASSYFSLLSGFSNFVAPTTYRCEPVVDYQSEVVYHNLDNDFNNFQTEALCNSYADEVDGNGECRPKYQVGEVVYDNKTEICGLFGDNVLCYPPKELTDDNINNKISQISNRLSCSYNNGYYSCSYKIPYYYSLGITPDSSYPEYYKSDFVDQNNGVGCGFGSNKVKCYKRVLPFTIESEHNPYPDSLYYKTYYENTFDDVYGIQVNLNYSTQRYYDYVYVYYMTESGYEDYYSYSGSGSTTINLTGNYIRIAFYTNSWDNNYSGFTAIITPIYDPNY